MDEYILKKSNNKNKRYKIITPDNKNIHFGSSKHDNYTIHKNTDRKKLYINRHKKLEKNFWTHSKNNLLRPSYWSRFLLWEKPNLNDAIKFIENKQKIKIIIK